MAQFLISLTDAIILVDDFMRYDELNNKFKDEKISIFNAIASWLLTTGSIASSSTALGFNLLEIIFLFRGKDAETLRQIKSIEASSRLYSAATRLALETLKLQSSEYKTEDWFRFIARGIISPASELRMVDQEERKYIEMAHLEKYHHQYSYKATRPVFEPRTMITDPIGLGVIVEECISGNHKSVSDVAVSAAKKIEKWKQSCGTRLIDPFECEQSIVDANSKANNAATLKIAADFASIPAVVSKVVQFLHGDALYQRFASFMRERGVTYPSDDDILNLQSIPDLFHQDDYQDEVFSRYLCAITHRPIRNPFRDPDGRTLYERSDILERLATNPTSPATGAPMTASDLIDERGIQIRIDQRLLFHARALRQFLDNNPSLSPNPTSGT